MCDVVSGVGEGQHATSRANSLEQADESRVLIHFSTNGMGITDSLGRNFGRDRSACACALSF